MAGKTASIAKITRPVLAGSSPRNRLFRLVDRARKRQVVWVSGPPGSGKTTLVSSYIAARRLPGLWYRLDEGDADPATFFHYLGLAARRAAPRIRRPFPTLTHDQHPAVSVFAQRYFESLFPRLQSGSVIVFDDYQKVPGDSAFHTMFRDGLSLLPSGISVVLISRVAPPSPFARLRASRSMEVIGWDELRLTPGETEAIARLRWRGKRRAVAVRRLHAATGGWAAGVVLRMETSESWAAEPRRRIRNRPQEIFDYFAGEVLENVDEEMQVFLVKSAQFPRMTARMAERLTGLSKAGKYLAYLNRNNYFTEMHADPEPVYEYHPLFREFLLSRGPDIFSEKYLRRVRRSAAAILEECGHAEEAARLLRDIGDAEGLGRVLRTIAPSLARQGRTRVLGEWLGALPEPFRAEDPWILYWSGVCRLGAEPGTGQADFENAFRRFRERGDREGCFLAWAGVVESIIYGHGALRSIDPWFSVLETLLRLGKSFPSAEIEDQVTCTMLKALSLRRPPGVAMDSWAERAARIARTTPDLSLKVSSLLNLAYYMFHGGDLRNTGLILHALRETVRRSELSPLARLTVCWIEAAHANMSAAHDRCRKIVTEGLALAEATGVHLMDFLLMGHGALSSLHLGDRKAARDSLRRMASSLPAARPWEAAFYHYLAGWESLDRADLAEASLHSEKCLSQSERTGNPWTEALAWLQGAFVADAQGDADESARRLERSSRIGTDARMRFVRYACSLARAYFSLGRGEEEAAIPHLREGLRTGREQGFVGIYLWRPGLLERVAATALERGIEVGYVRDLVRKNGLVPETAIPGAERWPWPLKVYTLGKFELLREDGPAPLPRKVQHKPLLMLKVLIALGGKDVPEAGMSDILWPDAEGDLAHQSFSTTLRRLRRLLGDERAILLREGRVTLTDRICWVDAFGFESLLSRAEETPFEAGSGSRDRSWPVLLERAVALYRGPFLLGEPDRPWVVSRRERLRSRFLRAVGALGRSLERHERWEEAIACYERGLEVDDLAEEFYRRLMTCHQRFGRGAEAMAVYQRCRAALSSALGISPSPETEAIRTRILGA